MARRLLQSLALLISTAALALGSCGGQGFTTSDGRQYTYDYVKARDGKPTLLLLHGFPASRADWRYQIANLTAAGFGVLAPDLLGHGDSDRPIELEAYNTKHMSRHFVEILNHEGVDKVVGVGHDFGAVMLSRAYAWYPARFTKLAFVTVGYAPPGGFMDIDAINAAGLAKGQMLMGYWYFFNSYNAASVITSHLESAFSLMFPVNASDWAPNLGSLAAARAWLTANKTAILPPWLTEDYRVTWLRRYTRPNQMEASLAWYRSSMRGIGVSDEAGFTLDDLMIKVPVLVVGSGLDPLWPLEGMAAQTQPFAQAGYTEQRLQAGHWPMHEKANELSEVLLEFVGERAAEAS